MKRGLDPPPAEIVTLVELLRWRAMRQPQGCVYTYLIDGEREGVQVTYAELDRQARAIGALLQGYRVGRKPALLVYPAGPGFAPAFFGCLYGGATPVPTSTPDEERPERTISRLRAIVRDAQPAVALTTSPLLAFIKRFAERAPELLAIRWLATDMPGSALSEEWWDPGARHGSPAYLQYTSGSTTAPRGVMVTHRNVLHNSAHIGRAWGYTPESVSVAWVPHFHDDGLVHGTIQPVVWGFRAIFMPPSAFVQRPLRWLLAISRYRATHSGGPNFAYALCARKIPPGDREALDLRSWRVAYNAAEPIRPESLREFASAFAPCGFRWRSFYPSYGLAEATLLVTTKRSTDDPVLLRVESTALEQGHHVVTASGSEARARTLVGCGRAVGDTQVVIARPETLTRCPQDEVGEIWISDPSVAQGYANRPEETEQTFQAHLADTGEGPFLRTGDLGFLQDGELFVTGRLKDLIIVRGQNHYPEDIEWTVQESHPAVRPGCCAAFSVDAEGEERPVVVAEIAPSHGTAPAPAAGNMDGSSRRELELLAEAIRQAVSERHGLHVYSVLLLEPRTIPKTSSGKIQRHACRAGFLAGTLEVVGGISDAATPSEP